MASESNIVPLPQAVRIEAEAAAWIARLDKDEANESDRIAFQAWCKLSDLHQQAADRLLMLWSDMNCLRSSTSITPHVPPPSGKAQERAPIQT